MRPMGIRISRLFSPKMILWSGLMSRRDEE
jgi:hypothetical protein